MYILWAQKVCSGYIEYVVGNIISSGECISSGYAHMSWVTCIYCGVHNVRLWIHPVCCGHILYIVGDNISSGECISSQYNYMMWVNKVCSVYIVGPKGM